MPLNNPLKFIDPTGMTCVYNDGFDPDNPVGDNGDGQGCAGVGVAAGDPVMLSKRSTQPITLTRQ